MYEKGIIQIRFDELDVDELFWDELEESPYIYNFEKKTNKGL